MASFRISSRTTKPVPSDARRVMYRDENLMVEVLMKQWKVNKT